MNISDLIFTGFNQHVAALERGTGSLVWKWQAPQGQTYVTLLLDGDILVVSVDGYMYGLDPLTGQVLWANPMKGFGIGVASLVSVNGAASSLPMAAAAIATAAAAASATHVVH